ncbi:hypothetical protein RhiJN_10578 [Ceratobasidium sp. AG-Ba]|nr:hypothetical protein RhiJN_10578 [Ceratobasidium sp. AG-Ba]QRW11315.1 hypothetical protein RhiLY_10314 [Ceratobasidium sp. AG-Ba]
MSVIELASNTSILVSRRGAEWSSSVPNPRARLTIAFPHPWDTHSGAVFDWYDQQSHTRFSTIEHRKTRDGPFFHEFLLIHLDGDFICRIKRSGDGSSLDALRRRASVARDMIQCYPANDPLYRLDQEKSDIISEIHFPHELDLLDILAIIFAIHLGESSQKYTLTRYNCYFICWAIIGVLSRGVAKWHNAITPESQRTITDKALQILFEPTAASRQRPSAHSIMPNICSMLQFDYSFVTDILREELFSKSTPSNALRDVLAGAFWSWNWTGLLRLRFQRLLYQAADISLDSPLMHPSLKEALSEAPTTGHGTISRFWKRAAHSLDNIEKVKHAASKYQKTSGFRGEDFVLLATETTFKQCARGNKEHFSYFL